MTFWGALALWVLLSVVFAPLIGACLHERERAVSENKPASPGAEKPETFEFQRKPHPEF
jgi:hypothetical protein